MNLARLIIRDQTIEFQSIGEVAEAQILLSQIMSGMLNGEDTWSEIYQYDPIPMTGQYILGVNLRDGRKKLNK